MINMTKTPLLDLTFEEFETWIIDNGYKKFAAKQVYVWIFKHKVYKFSEMTNISRKLRQHLEDDFTLFTIIEEKRLVSEDGTTKFVLQAHDNKKIECVMIFDSARRTLCISSQIGCALECDFCLTGKSGFGRNLSMSEILEQILWMFREDMDPTNIVFMGMGEPLLNLDNLSRALDTLFRKEAFVFSKRKTTISTVGIPSQMLELDRRFPHLSWAISLHSPFDAERDKLMPINKKYPLSELIDTMKQIDLKKRQYFTIEYIMIHDLNVDRRHANELVRIMHGVKFKVNLIPYNNNPYCDYESATSEEMEEFHAQLKRKRIVANLRKSKGSDILAACGQLAREKQLKKDNE